MTLKASTLLLILIAAALGLASGPSLARDAARPVEAGNLPGVKGGHAIVKPLPAPGDRNAPATGSRFRIGDTEVRIGGSITIDVGVGSTGPTRN